MQHNQQNKKPCWKKLVSIDNMRETHHDHDDRSETRIKGTKKLGHVSSGGPASHQEIYWVEKSILPVETGIFFCSLPDKAENCAPCAPPTVSREQDGIESAKPFPPVCLLGPQCSSEWFLDQFFSWPSRGDVGKGCRRRSSSRCPSRSSTLCPRRVGGVERKVGPTDQPLINI